MQARIVAGGDRLVRWWSISLLALPIWWALGIEQFVWPVLAAVLAVAVAKGRSWKVIVSPVMVLWCLFLLVYLASGFAIDSTFRWVSFVRSFASLATGALAYFVCRNAALDAAAVRRLALTLSLLTALVSLVALVGVVGLWRPTFTAPVAWVLPEWITETSFGRLIALRKIGRWAFMPLLGGFFRPDSLFLFPTLFSTALAIGLPFSVRSLWNAEDLRQRCIAASGVALVVGSLFFSASRTAWLASAVGGILWLGLRGGRSKALLALAGAVTVAALAFGVARTESAAEAGSGAWERVVDFRQGSTLNRTEVYEESLSGVAERPWFGFGTERDIDAAPYPAGSHSLYLAMLYRHGIVGFAVFLMLMVASWRECRPVVSGDPAELTRWTPWVHAAVWVSGLTTVLITDVTVVVIWWTAVGLLAAARDLALAEVAVDG